MGVGIAKVGRRLPVAKKCRGLPALVGLNVNELPPWMEKDRSIIAIFLVFRFLIQLLADDSLPCR